MLGACGIDPEVGGPPAIGRQALPPAELTGVVFEGYAEGVRDLIISASRAEVDIEHGVARLDKVRISFAGEERGPTRISAPFAEFRLDSDDFVLSGGVRGSTQFGERFSTSEVRYDHASRKLRSASRVKVQRANLQLEAEGMEIDVASRTIRLTGKVQAEMQGG